MQNFAFKYIQNNKGQVMHKISKILILLGLASTSYMAQAAVGYPLDSGCTYQYPTATCTPTSSTTSTTSISDGPASTNVNMGYGGLKWTFGEGYVPEIVGGFRYASVTSSGATQGADISIAFKVTGKMELDDLIHFGKLRAKYLNGMDYLQGEVGGGWDFAKKGLFAGIGAQGPYVNSGVDYDFSSKDSFSKSFSPFVMFNSIGIYNTPHGTNATTNTTTTQTCQSPTNQPSLWTNGTLLNNTCQYTFTPPPPS
jgi:hypothetical protein